MSGKLSKAIALLFKDVSLLKNNVERLEKLRPIVRHGRDCISPYIKEIAAEAVKLIPEPKDGISPDIKEIAAEAVKLIPEPKPGRDAIPPSVRDVADVVLAKIEKPKDGVSPDIKEIAAEAVKLIPEPKDGISPTPESIAEKMPVPRRGTPGKNGVSITDVQLNNNDLFVFLDGKKKKAGKIKLPVISAPFSPGGGGSARTVEKLGFPWKILSKESFRIEERRQVTIHGQFILDGVLLLENEAQLVLEN